MALDEVSGQAWTRKHDDPTMPVVPSAPQTVYARSLEELIEICSTRKPSERMHAAGSHWALSTAAMSDSTFVETHDPNEMHQAMGRTLYEVVGESGCLNPHFITALASRTILPFDTDPANVSVVANEGLYPVHIETGKRVYQLYSELDVPDNDPQSLATLLRDKLKNTSYLRSWSFKTLGSAGGQTVFGALTTGTHGGDFHLEPIADSVMALHLVTDGGKHYWIEPASPTKISFNRKGQANGPPLTDDVPLKALYGQSRYGGPHNFEIIRDDDTFNAVLVSAGRFGIVYSIVIAAVRQYCLHTERRLTTWQDVKGLIKDPNSTLYTGNDQPSPVSQSLANKHLQIAVSVTPFDNFSKNLAGVTKKWNVPLPASPSGSPPGRAERRGENKGFDALIQANRFTLAGNSAPYSPDPAEPGMTVPPDFLSMACSNADFMDGIVSVVTKEIESFVKSKGAVVGATIGAIAAIVTGGAALAALLAALAAILPVLAAILAAIRGQAKPLRLGHVMNDMQKVLLNPANPPGSPERMGGIFAWQAIAFAVFSGQQAKADSEAISYASMDGCDYLDKSCSGNVDSIEVFFDATDPNLVAYVDALLAFEIGQEVAPLPRAFVGYISLRFTGPTRALLGQQRFPLTCSIEVSGLRDVSGATELINFAILLALDSNFKGILHWGQRNESNRGHVQERFGDTFANQSGPLHKWRSALSNITQNGKLDGFSSAFTRQTGLEIVTPIVGSLSATGIARSQLITIHWDCSHNPAGTEISLQVINPRGTKLPLTGLPLAGQQQLAAMERGSYSVSLTAAIDFAGERREASRQVHVTIV